MTLVEAFYASRSASRAPQRGRLRAWAQARITDAALLTVLGGLWGGAFAVKLGWLAA